MSVTVLEKAQRFVELAQEQVLLLERVGEVQKEMKELADDMGYAEPPPAGVSVNRPRGRPAANAKANGHIVVNGKKKTPAPASVLSSSETVNLPTLLTQIAAAQKKPLKLADYVSLAREAGYEERSEAKDFPNMVYQALLKLVKRKVLEKNQDTRDYYFIGDAA